MGALKSLNTKEDFGKPDIFQYMEYRVFLADYVEWRQKANPKFSKRAFSLKYLGSTAILYTVIQGGRDFGAKLRGRCMAALEMGDKEGQFFDLLIQHNQAKSDLERNFLFDKLSKFRHSKAWVLRENQHRYYSKWYYAVVFNYLGLDHKKARPADIAKEIYPPIKVEQVQEAINLLLELELIKKSETGYALTKNHLVSGEAFKGDVALGYNQQIHGISTDMVHDEFRKFKTYNTQIITTSNSSLNAIRERLTAFQDEIQDIVSKDKNTDQVCTMIFQIIPNTR